jgi:hypothetical protein
MTQPLDCPEPDNYAAVALQLQETALQAEQRLYVVERALRAAANRPTIVQTTTAVRTGIAFGNFFNEIDPGGVANTVNFNNMPFGWSYSSIPVVPGAGMYDIGFSGNLIASGAVTDNSVRTVRIQQLRTLPGGGALQEVIDTAQGAIFEANVGGGMDMTVVGTFHLQPGDEVNFDFMSGNVGSTMNVSTGAIYWATFLGSEAAVETF